MPTLHAPLMLKDILSKAPGNPVLWQLFLAELAGAMHCNSGFLAIVDLGRGGGVHHLYRYNVAADQESHFELNLRETDSFDACVIKHPYRVFCSNMLSGTFRPVDNGIKPDASGERCRFGVSIPLNGRYAHCLYLNGSRPAAEPELKGNMKRLQSLLPPLQNALEKDQWLSLYSQIMLLTGKRIAAYVIVDCKLNVLFSDPVFTRVIEAMDCVEIRGNRLAFLNKAAEQRVLSVMTGIGCDTVIMQNQCASCAITVIPARTLDNLYAWEFYKKGVVLTFTSDHENNPAQVRLMALYNLTHCEALCALQFIATPSIPGIAASTHRSTETIRHHIKSIMQKLDVHNQGALMKKLLAIAAL